MNQLLIFIIRLYQKYISPYKGFQCAHAYLYHDTSCSNAVITIIESNGLIVSIDKIKTRFRACRAAYLTLVHEDRSNKYKRNSRDRKNNGYEYCDPGSACDVAECVTDKKFCDFSDLSCDCSLF